MAAKKKKPQTKKAPSRTKKPETAEVKNEEATTNPYGANQYQLDPRQRLCWDYYIDPKSDTFSNAMQSAIKAGYEEAYANQITTTEWFKEKVRRMNMLSKAEKVLDEMLEMPVQMSKSVDGGEVVKTEPALVKIKQDTAKFVAERLGKDEGYSTRSELTGKGGNPLEFKTMGALISDLDGGVETKT